MAPFPPYGAPRSPGETRRPRSDDRATAALILGLLSITCLGFLAGIPAIVIGAMSRKEIDRSQGALTGRGVAAGAIVTGLFGTGLSLVVMMGLLGGLLEAAHPPSPRTESPMRVPVAAGTRSYGSLEVVDLEADGVLAKQLTEVAKSSRGKGRTVILQTYVRSSRECAEVAAALPDPRMQRALANVTLVRVDIEAFEDELKAMRVDTESVPWFYKLDSNVLPSDAISADEWDANTAENMAPVLGDFARGILGGRRSPSPIGTAL